MRNKFKLFLSALLFAISGATSAQTTSVNEGSVGQQSGQTQPAAQASPSSQVVYTRPILERSAHIVPFVDANSASPSASFAIPGAHVTYFGGPVISNVHVVQVLYGSGSYLPNVSSTTRPSMATFFADVTQSSHFDLLNEYSTTGVGAADGGPSSNQMLGHGFFDGQVTITPSAANNGAIITDAQIQAELLSQVAAGNLPAPVSDLQGNSNTLYMVYFPAGKTISAGGSSSCVRGGFCGYHNSTTGTFGSKRLYYGVLPDTQPPSACGGLGCGSTDPFTNAMNVSSHELAEAVTDPDVGPVTALARPLAWADPVNNEIGDICVGQLSSVTVAGTSYTVQREFSNFQNDCATNPAQFQIFGGLTILAGQKFDLPVTLQSDSGAVLAGYTGTVHFTSTDPGAFLPPDYTFGFADAGTHTFVVSLSTVGNQTITLSDTNSPALPGSSGYTVIAGGASILNVAQPLNATPGVSIPVVVMARAGFPNNEIASGYNGTVHFSSSDAAAVLPPDSKLTNGIGTFAVTLKTAGSQTLSVRDTVNTLLFGSASSFVAAAAANPTATAMSVSANPGSFGQATTFTATVTQKGSPVTAGQVDFYADGRNFTSGFVDATGHVSGTGTLQGGAHTIFAEYGGGGTTSPNSSSAPLALQINPAGTTVAASSSLSPSTFGDKIGFSAVMSSALGGTNGGSVTFTDNGVIFAILDASSSSVGFADTTMAPGSHTIVASYSGNANFASSVSAPIVQVVNPAPPRDYKLQANLNSITLLAGQTAKLVLSTTSVSGFSGSVKFGCGNLPAFTTCTFSPSQAFVNSFSPVVTTTLSVKTTGPHASLIGPSVHGISGNSTYAGLWVFGPFVFAGILVALPRRRNRWKPKTMILMSLALLGAVTSCGGGGSPPPAPPPAAQVTPAGTSSFAITAVGTPTAGSPGANNPNQQLNVSITVQQ
jgi:hypothetical protein